MKWGNATAELGGLLLALCVSSLGAAENENLFVNGGFENGREGWNDLWTRTPGGQFRLDETIRHNGQAAARIEHTGSEDWSMNHAKRRAVVPGEIYQLSGWLRGEGQGTATFCVTLRDKQGRVIDWMFGGRTAPARGPWRQLRSRFIIPAGAAEIEPRIIGREPAVVWIDDVHLELTGTVDELRKNDLPQTLELTRGPLRLTFHTDDGRFELHDARNNHTWRPQSSSTNQQLLVLRAEHVANDLSLQLLDPASTLELEMTIRLTDDAEVAVGIRSTGPLDESIHYPHPFATQAGQYLVLPVNEGISYPVDDDSLVPMSYHLYGGHGLCMGWYGATDGQSGLMTIVETPDDAAVEIPRRAGRLCLAPRWLPQKGQFGPLRKIRYVAFDVGGYVAMCKRYRRYAQEQGRLVTLAEKRSRNTHVDQLIGAVNVWCWDQDSVGLSSELKAAGIERFLWSNRGTPESLAQLNELGVLTGRYDIFQDAMNPANFPFLNWQHPDWTSDAWPHDLTLNQHGDWVRGWRVQGKNGTWYPCGVLCDRQAIEYARRRIREDLRTHPYRCRFIDTTTAAPWRECYHEDHPMTRSESRHWKMELLRLVSEEFGMVTGSETGHEASVPYVHYFEGMLSLGPYRIPDAGRRMRETIDDPPERVVKFQTGHKYRLPLWELVYHDCVVAQWYWGDYNNKLPKLWDRRDLWNALYGTPPMFMFNRRQWRENKERFVQSYHTATPVARATGYSEMLSHKWLTDDHAVQQTQFANGVKVTVNFGETAFEMEDGTRLGPLEKRVEGLVTAGG